jgi:CrcB protein
MVGLGGAAGSLLRYAIGLITTSPWGTFTANILACFCLGFLVALRDQQPIQLLMWPLLAIGFCGGLSTFSSFILELSSPQEQMGRWVYLIGSLLAGMAFFALGKYCIVLFR